MIALNTHQRWLAALVLSGGLLTGGLMSASPGLAGQTAATPSAGSAVAATPGADGIPCNDTPDAGGEDDATDATDATDASGQQDQDGTAEQENDGGDDATEEESADPAATPEQENDGGDDATEGESGANDTQGDSQGDRADSADSADDASATPGALTEGDELLAQATISLDDATTAAQAAAQGPLGAVELEDVDGTLTFRVEIGEQDVLINAADGTVISVAPGDGTDDAGDDTGDDTGDDCADDDAAEANAAPGTLVEGQDLAPQATITLDQAIAAAQGAADGDLGVVGLEDQDGVLVYTVRIGDQEVSVEAATGEVIGTESDQED